MAERQGYADYQRTVNWDGPQVLREFNSHEGLFTTARFNAARFAYLAGFFTSVISSFLVTIQWFMEEGGGENVGRREFVLDEGITGSGQIHLPHLGPWFQIAMKGKPATLYEPAILLFNSNRVYPLEFLPQGPVLLKYSHVFAALGEENVFPLSYFAGPMRMGLTNTGANVKVTVSIEVEAEPGVFVLVDSFNTTSATGAATMYAPVGAWRVNVKVNGATTVGVQLFPFLSGSS
jgi:hypothetical protein